MVAFIGTRVRQQIGRSASLNETRTNTRRCTQNKGGAAVAGTGIAGVSNNTFTDTGNGLAVFAVGQDIFVTGATGNSRQYKVATSAAGTLTVIPTQVVNFSAGTLVDIRAAG
jgi:hypothetical protein